jgi:hypothetical protein
MAQTRRKPIAVHDRVTVHSFGSHAGTVTELNPTVTIQGRTMVPDGWVSVRLDDGREFHGHTDLMRAADGVVHSLAA